MFVITKSNWGGAQRYVFDLATRLPKEEFEVAVAHGGNGLLAEKLRAAGIRTVTVKNFERDVKLFKDIAAFFELLSLLRRERPDIVHLNSSKAGGIGALSARFTGIKNIIFTSHGLVFDEDRPFPVRGLLWCITWLTFFLCHTVILISQDTHARAKRMPLLSKKMKLVYNGIEPDIPLKPQEARAVLRQRIKNVPEDPALWVGTISELTKNKGLEYVLRALSLLKGYPWFFFVIGNEGEQRSFLQGLAQKLGIADRIFLAGAIPDAGKLLSAFDIFTLTSVKEGLPYVLLEAGVAGIPVVGSRIPGITDIVSEPSCSLLAPPKDHSSIAAALEKLLGSASERARLGKNLEEQVRSRFSLASMVMEMQRLYT